MSSSQSDPSSEPSSPAAEKLANGNRFDTMFGSDNESGAEEEVTSRKRNRSAVEDDEDEAEKQEELPEVDDDLFGDEEEGEAAPTHEEEVEDQYETTAEMALPRHPGPGPGSDSHIHLIQIPSFLSVSPQLFNPETFTLPTLPPDSTTSLYTAATSTIRFRQHPHDPSQLQSNARIIRWSDGSLSLQIASSPALYDLPSKSLTSDPKKPHLYDPVQDSHTYLLDPHETNSSLRVVGHATSALKVVSSSGTPAADSAINRLRDEVAKNQAARGSVKRNPMDPSEMTDPEKVRREAEKAAKENEKRRKKAEAKKAREKANEYSGRGLGMRRHHGSGTRSKRDSPPIYGRGGGRKEDEYDLNDEFIEGSDEEEEVEEGSEEEEEEEEFDRRRRKGRDDRKRRRVVEDEDDDE
ncbi:hypothetical protein EX30DRAFT_395022 [Ascodesmis nigricans]|uniref:Leo1-domain-containing protein n=1 Tax=Ascodesmis nigricans TaxID=341454 RepID=A0A4S2MZC4_9PEZI|nr:hypothetical protein EX30DRAFT_395022 [Ascodesmis nigricans]